MSTKPNLFLVGAPKCGTTSIYHHLAHHPDVFMSPVKEPHYFSDDIDFKFRTSRFDSVQEYQALFEKGADRRLRGEASVWYLYSRVAAHNIHRYNPDAIILCAIRNPVDMMFSMYRFSRKKGSETLPTFAAALAAEPNRKAGHDIPRTTFVPSSLFYRDIACFSEQIQRYITLFGREQVHVVLLDDLKQDTQGLYDRLFSALGLPPTEQGEFAAHNVTDEIQSSHVTRLLRAFPHASEAVRALLPKGVRRRALRAAKALTPQAEEPPRTMEPALRKQLQEEFKPEIDRLSLLLERDLSGWYS